MKPRQLPIPSGWQIVNKGWTWKFDNFAWCSRERETIFCYTPYWFLFLQFFNFRRKVEVALLNHELAHAWGISGCDKITCISFESEMLGKKEAWWEPFLHALGMMFGGFKFCPECKAFLESKIAETKNA